REYTPRRDARQFRWKLHTPQLRSHGLRAPGCDCPYMRYGCLDPSLRSCALRFQYGSQGANELVDLFCRNDEWRKHAQDGFMSAVENESLLQKLLHDFLPGNG